MKACCDLEKKALLRVGVGSGLWRPIKGHGEGGGITIIFAASRDTSLGVCKAF